MFSRVPRGSASASTRGIIGRHGSRVCPLERGPQLARETPLAKILLVVAVIAAVYFIVRAYARALVAKRPGEAEQKPPEDMVQCAHCGVHLPRGESVAAGGRFFCSTEHRQLHGP